MQASGQDIFRKAYRKLTDEETILLETLKDQASALYDTMQKHPGSRNMSLAVTKLEEAVMWAVKAITA
jgi:hypothetical protein